MRSSKIEIKTVEVEVPTVTVQMTVEQAAILRALIGPLPRLAGMADLYSVYTELGDSLEAGEFLRVRYGSRSKSMNALSSADFEKCEKYF